MVLGSRLMAHAEDSSAAPFPVQATSLALLSWAAAVPVWATSPALLSWPGAMGHEPWTMNHET